MNSKSLMIILTENIWLYQGLSALMPEILCVHSRFSDSHLPDIVTEAERVLIVVDSRIFFRGEWSALSALNVKRPDARTVWLLLYETGWLFPEKNRKDWVLPQKLEPTSLHLALLRLFFGFNDAERVKKIKLTHTEQSLLPYFISDLSMRIISHLTGKDTKTLYTHRHRILKKTGLRLPAFLKFIYKRNQGVLSITCKMLDCEIKE
ncbi:transcriptional regulator [Enterobacter cloacae complex sp. ECC445]|uniref:transcriptional regulator n=1 Tax=Enterobacter cloacae complex TaxID=354276 RepID=UPI0012995E8D|nr:MULTISPECIES: transcriptional regulator [Enterobacter cloacae complex]MCG0456748.1 transcriptional regulator [Enterobacter cloacae complex sp. ECC445]MRG34129.1 transcriptional regulator [Enterobacter cancerogenus]QZY39531.1 transcriptional regulator [Enterobacter cancerogenus]